MVTDEPAPRRGAADLGGAEIIDLGETVTPAVVMGGRRDRWMGPTAIGAAIVVLVAGIVLASRPDLAFVAASPSGSPSVSDQSSNASPSPSASPRPARSISPPQPCVAGQFESDASLVARSGLSTWQLSTYELGNLEPMPRDDWTQVVAQVRMADPAAAIRATAGSEIRVSTFGLSCFGAATATFLRLDVPDGSLPVSSGGPLTSATASAAFAAPGPGDWLVRFVVAFPVPGDTHWVEASARLLVGAGEVPPRPAVLPNAPCRPADHPADATLFHGGVAVPGTAPGQSAPAPGPIPFGSVVEIRLAGDRCATAWAIQGKRRATPERPERAAFETAHRSAIADPAIASQNRFRFGPDQPIGTWDITATFSFPDGSELARRWSVTYEEIVVPALRIVAEHGGTASATASFGCSLYIEAPGGASYGEGACGSNLPAEPLERLVVPVGSRLGFDVAGWEIADWSAEAGTISGGAAEPSNFLSMEGGFLRGATSPPVDFPVPKAGSWALQLYATLVRADGLRATGSWYVLVDVR